MLKIRDSSNNILLILNITNNISDIVAIANKIENIDNDNLIELNYDKTNSFITINDTEKNIVLSEEDITLDNILKLNQENKIVFNFKNFKIDINPILIINNYSFTFKFIIEKFPCKIHIIYESSYENESLIILTENLK